METSLVQVARHGQQAYVRVTGRGSFQNAAPLKKFCEEMIHAGVFEFLIDLKECTYLDSTFLGTLAGIGQKLREAAEAAQANIGFLPTPGIIQVINASPRNTELIQNLGLDQLFGFRLLPTSWEENMKPLETPAAEAGEDVVGQTMLAAHEALISWDERNRSKFKDVVAYLKEDLGQESQ